MTRSDEAEPSQPSIVPSLVRTVLETVVSEALSMNHIRTPHLIILVTVGHQTLVQITEVGGAEHMLQLGVHGADLLHCLEADVLGVVDAWEQLVQMLLEL